MKKGITVITLVIYVMLFFSFSVFAILTTNNNNKTVLNSNGLVKNNESLSKLNFNMLNSCRKSYKYDIVSGAIEFSNGDSYKYDSTKDIVYKDGVTLITNVTKFNVIEINNKVLQLDVEFKKYDNILGRNLTYITKVSG